MMRSIMNQYDIIRDQLIFNYICYKLKIFRYDLDPLPSIQNKGKKKYYTTINYYYYGRRTRKVEEVYRAEPLSF